MAPNARRACRPVHSFVVGNFALRGVTGGGSSCESEEGLLFTIEAVRTGSLWIMMAPLAGSSCADSCASGATAATDMLNRAWRMRTLLAAASIAARLAFNRLDRRSAARFANCMDARRSAVAAASSELGELAEVPLLSFFRAAATGTSACMDSCESSKLAKYS